MGLQRVRRVLLRAVVLLYLMAIAAALVLAWTGPSREWYIATGGADITLNMDLSSTARWLATGLLGGLALLGLLALLADAAASRRERAMLAMSARLGTPGHTENRESGIVPAGRPDSATPVMPPFSRPVVTPAAGDYDAVVVGDQATQRLERSVTDTPPGASTPEADQRLAGVGSGQVDDEVTHQARRPNS